MALSIACLILAVIFCSSPDLHGPYALSSRQVADAMAEMAGHQGETSAQRAERLAVYDAARVAAARQAANEEYYAQYTFRPAINERSRRLAKVWLNAATTRV